MGRTGAFPASIYGPPIGQGPGYGLPNEANKCRDITLDKEPTAPTLNRWLISLKEAARNAFTYDGTYAVNWIRSAEDAKSFQLNVPCTYAVLDARLNTALRACLQSPALISRIDKMTAEAHRTPQMGCPSTKVIWCIIDNHRASPQSQEAVLVNELLSIKMPHISQECGEHQLEKFLNNWDQVESQIVSPVSEALKLHVFLQQMRDVPCLSHDIHTWDRSENDERVQNFQWISKAARDAVNRWRMKTNQYALQRSLDARSPSEGRSARNPAASGAVRRPSPFSRDINERARSPGGASRSMPPAGRGDDTRQTRDGPDRQAQVHCRKGLPEVAQCLIVEVSFSQHSWVLQRVD